MEDGDINRTLNRDAVADVWRRTLAGIPSIFGRVAYLASLRNSNTGRYEHHGLAMMFGDDEAHRALAQSHEHSFAQWLGFELSEQKADLDLYISGLPEDSRTVVESWLRLPPYMTMAPAGVRESERDLFAHDFEALLEALRHEYSLAAPHSDS